MTAARCWGNESRGEQGSRQMKPAGLRSPPCPLCTNRASCSETLLGMDFGGGGRGMCLGSIPAGLANEDVAGDGCLLKAAAEDDLLSTWVMKNVPLSFFFFFFFF